MPMLPVDSSTVSTLAVVCAVLVFVFAFSSGMKPAAALLVAVVVGFVLKAIGIIPIGFMVVAAFALVVGIFKNLMSKSNDAYSNPTNLTKPTVEKNNDSDITSSTTTDLLERLDSSTGTWVKLETEHKESIDPIHAEQKKSPIKTNHTGLHFGSLVGSLVGLLVLVVPVMYLVVNNTGVSNHEQPINSSNKPDPVTSPVAPLVAAVPKEQTPPPSQVSQEAIAIQKCDAFAVEHTRKSYTLTSQEHKEDYDKLYNSCLAEELKPPTDSSTTQSFRDYELLKAYQTIKINNDQSRHLLTEVWDMLPEQAKSTDGFWLKNQRAWVKSKQKACGKVLQGKDVSTLTNKQLLAEAVLLKCDNDANLARAEFISGTLRDISQTNNTQ